jgi:uncharacterized protein (TIGR03437 family)
MRTAARRIGRTAAAGLLLSSASFGYYHFVHYLTRTAPFVPVYEKFDLNALPNKTVQFRISDQAPVQLAPNDTLAGVYSQIRAAARVWNGVESSDLRITFGGIGSVSAPQTTPAIDVIFDEVPPGLVAMGAPTVRSDVVTGANGPFVPITRSVLVLRSDLSGQPASSSESFFSTLVHEFGHTLGLQHTLTSSAMSTGPTRATTRSKPLAADDVAGLSILYPAPGFATATGVIAGRVVLTTGAGVSLASVVAISPNGPAVSALTHPDGSFRIEGLPAGLQYLVYAHPLPPPGASEVSPANITLPRDPGGAPIAAGSAFDTVFFPGVKNPAQAFVFSVAAGQTLEGVNFSVQPRASLPLYEVQTYSLPGPAWVKPATLSRYAARFTITATGRGLSANNAPAPGLAISAIGSATVPPASIRPYAPAPSYVQFDVEFSPFSPDGVYHLVFSLANDIYVLPAAFQATSRPTPSITSLAPAVDSQGARAVLVSGTGLAAETQFLFDGQPALRVAEDAGRFLVTPPPATAGHRASLVAVNADGQSSLFLQPNPILYTYETGDLPAVVPAPSTLPAGTEAMVEFNAANGSFADGQTQLGFGVSDIAVRRLWVVSPTRLLANVAVSAAAPSLATTVTIANGLQMVAQPFAFLVQPANPRQLTLSSQVVSAATGQPGVQAGSAALVAVPSLTQAQIAAGLSLTFNGAPVQILSAAPGQITFLVPAGAAAGPAVLRLQAGAETSLPIAIPIELPAPVIVAALAGGATVDATRPARSTELVTLVVGNLGDSPSASRMRLVVGGIEHQIALVLPASNQPGFYQVAFFLNPAVPAGAQPVLLTLDGRTSAPFPLQTRGQ